MRGPAERTDQIAKVTWLAGSWAMLVPCWTVWACTLPRGRSRREEYEQGDNGGDEAPDAGNHQEEVREESAQMWSATA